MVILLRHGATPENNAEPEVLRGTDDNPLSDRGREEMRATAAQVCKYPVVEIRADRYLRDQETAEIVSEACGGVPITLSPQLEPLNIGILSGQVKEKVWPIIAFLFSNPDIPFPSGETVRSFLDEFAGYWWQVYEEYGGRDDAAVVLVSHGTEFRVLNSILYGTPIPLDYEEHVKTGDMVVVN